MTIKSAFEDPIFLIQGGDPKVVADKFVEFVHLAKKSLHIAIYDFQLEGALKTKVVGALTAAAHRGVEVKVAYDHTKVNEGKVNKGTVGSDPAPRGTQAFVTANFAAGTGVKTMPIAGSHLMHHKYIIRDGSTDAAAVWTGSANFTLGAWSLQENNILRIHSRELAGHFEGDFDDLWQSGDILRTGANDFATVAIGHEQVEVAFSPGKGSAAASLFVDAVQGAGKTVWLSTMVLSSGPILGALVDHLRGGGDIRGVYDRTQMEAIERDWQPAGKEASPKLAMWLHIKPFLKGKKSTPFSDTSPHDFMHDKLLVTDTVVVTGSFNLSRNAESNAENVLSLPDAHLVKAYKAHVDKLIEIYG